jgi:hypothetical protein
MSIKIKSPVYISGPMSGLPDENYPAFWDAAEKLRDLGFEVVSPAEQEPQDTWEAYMEQDIALLSGCNSMVLLPGWENSRGANIEIEIAKEMGIDISPLWAVLAQKNPRTAEVEENTELQECGGLAMR